MHMVQEKHLLNKFYGYNFTFERHIFSKNFPVVIQPIFKSSVYAISVSFNIVDL